jgi:hypothetical protein
MLPEAAWLAACMAKKAKKEDASEVHKEQDVDDNKNNNKTTT